MIEEVVAYELDADSGEFVTLCNEQCRRIFDKA
jgi:hypothetical protein